MPMDPQVQQQVEKSLAAVTQMYRDKQLPAEQYYKCVLCLAYEFSSGDDHLRAASMAQTIPLEYYRETQRQQMIEDPNFAYISYTLALNLFQAGLVHLGGATPSSTMPAASA